VTSGDVIRPFRWDITRRNQLGSLPDVDPPETYTEFEEDLIACCARLIAFAGDSDLVFVGRSPEPIFDLLSGLLLGTSWEDRLRLLNVSIRDEQPTREQLRTIYPYFAEVGLEPHALARRPRTLALVDVVAQGWTFKNLMEILEDWTVRERAEWRAVARKLRIVGLTWREWASPKTWRWQQHAEWVDRLRPHEIKNVSLPWPLWEFLGNNVSKTSRAFPPTSWGDEKAAIPSRDPLARQALALAIHLFDLGRQNETRRRFARVLAGEPAMTESWFRSLILEIKR
jgi:hypothetical protein